MSILKPLLRTHLIIVCALSLLLLIVSAIGTQAQCLCIVYAASDLDTGYDGLKHIRLLDLRSNARSEPLYSGFVTHLQGLPGGKVGFYETTGWREDFATVLDTKTGEIQRMWIQMDARILFNAPVWSSDGRHFVYTDRNFRIRMHETASSEEVPMVAADGVALAWSADSEALIILDATELSENQGYISNIYLLDLNDGSREVIYTVQEETIYNNRQTIFDWSPTQDVIAFSFHGDPHILHLNSTQATVIESSDGYNPRWSPNGDLAYIMFEDITTQRFVVHHRNGYRVSTLLDDMYYLNHFDWMQY